MRSTAKITVVIVLVLIIGFGVSTILTIQRESALARRAEQDGGAAAHRAPWWRASRPPCSRSGPTSPAASSRTCELEAPVSGLMVYRRNWVEAFTDLATLREVSKEAELPRRGHGLHREDAPRAGPHHDGAALPAAPLETLQTQEALESRDGATTLHPLSADRQPGALPGLPRHGPHGARGGARGHLDGAGAGRGRAAAQPPDPDRRS